MGCRKVRKNLDGTILFGVSSRRASISIHAPRVGSDVQAISQFGELYEFQSTLPVWGATHVAELPIEPVDISIHAPRVGSDDAAHS